jgi:hypothetical protein
MAYAASINAYPDIRAVLDKALASEKGLRLTFATPEEAITFKGRVHSYRYKERKENRKVYPEDHPLHGHSAYDPLMVKTESPTVVKIIRLENQDYNIEELE